MLNEEGIRFLVIEAMDEYPSLTKPDAVRLVMNLMKNVHATKSILTVDICYALMYNYSRFNLC